MQNLLASFRFLILSGIILGLFYPLVILVIGQFFFPYQANGSLIFNSEGKIIGSELIGQRNLDAKYFCSRPSAAGEGYDPLKSSASNLSLSSPTLQKNIRDRYIDFSKNQDQPQLVPIDIITSSASGLDPHISVEAAYIQIERVAKTRNISPYRIRFLVDEMVERPQYFIFGSYRVNVLKLNLELDERFKAENVR